MRADFRKELNLEKEHLAKVRQSLVSTTYKPKFAHYNAMMFARSDIETADSSGNVVEDEENMESEDQQAFEDSGAGDFTSKKDIVKLSPSLSASSAVRITNRMVQEPINMIDDDEDMAFFKTLLSSVAHIPDSQKLLFRTKLNAIVHKYVFDQGDGRNSLINSDQSCQNMINPGEDPDLTNFRTLRHFTKQVIGDNKLAMRVDFIETVRDFAFPKKNKRQKISESNADQGM